MNEKERGQRERRGRGMDVDGGVGGKGGGGGCDQKRKEGRARKKSTSEDYGNDIHFFSLSASCFSRALSGFFLSPPLFLAFSLRLSSSPLPLPLVSPAIRRRFLVLLLPKSCENLGMHIGWSGREKPMPHDNTVRKIIKMARRTRIILYSI